MGCCFSINESLDHQFNSMKEWHMQRMEEQHKRFQEWSCMQHQDMLQRMKRYYDKKACQIASARR